MKYHGRARVDPRNPQAFAICDRCGFMFNNVNLAFQHDWSGKTMVNKQIMVCAPCTDRPQAQLRTIVLPPDPQPIKNKRPQQDYGSDPLILSDPSAVEADPTGDVVIADDGEVI